MTYTTEYFQRDIAENWFKERGLLRPDQLFCYCYALGWPYYGNDATPRKPGLVVSVGCGEGMLEAELERVTKVVGVDPQSAAQMLYRGSMIKPEWTEDEHDADTVIFCESLEHIPAPTTFSIINSLRPGARVIIANWRDHHPIPIDDTGWDHVTRVDDDYFSDLARGHEVICRDGSRLVFEI